MAQRIIKTTTGKVQIWVNGLIQKSLSTPISYTVANDDRIDLVDSAGQNGSLFASQVNYTQIAPADAVAQSFQDSQELAEFLDANFFFDVSGSDSSAAGTGDVGTYFTPQNDVIVGTPNTPSYAANTLHAHAIFIPESMLITDLVLNKRDAAFTGVVGLYDIGAKTAGILEQFPIQKLWQSAEFTTAIGNDLIEETPNVQLSRGWYAVVTHTSSAAVYYGIANSYNFWGLDKLQPLSTLRMTFYTHMSVALTYNSTLPDIFPTAPAPALATTTQTQPLITLKKQL